MAKFRRLYSYFDANKRTTITTFLYVSNKIKAYVRGSGSDGYTVTYGYRSKIGDDPATMIDVSTFSSTKQAYSFLAGLDK